MASFEYATGATGLGSARSVPCALRASRLGVHCLDGGPRGGGAGICAPCGLLGRFGISTFWHFPLAFWIEPWFWCFWHLGFCGLSFGHWRVKRPGKGLNLDILGWGGAARKIIEKLD